MSDLSLTPDLTASKAWGELSKRFAAARLDSPVIDARILVCHALGMDRLGLLKEPHRLLGEAAGALAEAARRRLAREPVSRIVGQRAFYGRPFLVTAATLDPRPDSETLIGAALQLDKIAGEARRAPPRILDLGTGTGCLLITLLAELPGSSGVGVDASADALLVAEANAVRLGVGERARFEVGDFAKPPAAEFALVVANPPYIRSGDIAGLAPEVAEFDPKLALDGGADGLSAYRAILAGLPAIEPGGSLLFEVGAGQAPDVAALMEARLAGLGVEFNTFDDFSGTERVVSATFPRS